MEYEVNACRDAPDERDILYWSVAKETVTVPERVFRPVPLIHNQWLDPLTKMACWQYGMIHGVNTMNDINNEWVQRDPKPNWLTFVNAHKTPRYNPIEKWSSLQDNLNFTTSLWAIEWYVKIDKLNKEEYQLNLAKKRCLYTGSSNIDWRKTRDSDDKYAVIGKGAGHIFAIVWYGKKWLVCVNSYWPDYMDDGYFYIHREDIGALFSCYALIDAKDYRTMEQWKLARKKNSKPKDRFAKIRGKYN